MKKQLLLILLAIVGMSYSSISYAQIAKDIEGTYYGTLTVTVSEEEPVEMDQPIFIIASAEDEITLQINDFSFTMGDFPVENIELVVPGIKVTKEGEAYSFTGTPLIDLGAMKLPATINGNVDAEGSMSLSLSITQLVQVEVEFKGGKK